MDNPFFVNLVYSNMNSIFNILNVIMTYNRVLASNNLKIFLTFWPFEPHFLINFYLIEKTCTLIAIDRSDGPVVERLPHNR